MLEIINDDCLIKIFGYLSFTEQVQIYQLSWRFELPIRVIWQGPGFHIIGNKHFDRLSIGEARIFLDNICGSVRVIHLQEEITAYDVIDLLMGYQFPRVNTVTFQTGAFDNRNNSRWPAIFPILETINLLCGSTSTEFMTILSMFNGLKSVNLWSFIVESDNLIEMLNSTHIKHLGLKGIIFDDSNIEEPQHDILYLETIEMDANLYKLFRSEDDFRFKNLKECKIKRFKTDPDIAKQMCMHLTQFSPNTEIKLHGIRDDSICWPALKQMNVKTLAFRLQQDSDLLDRLLQFAISLTTLTEVQISKCKIKELSLIGLIRESQLDSLTIRQTSHSENRMFRIDAAYITEKRTKPLTLWGDKRFHDALHVTGVSRLLKIKRQPPVRSPFYHSDSI